MSLDLIEEKEINNIAQEIDALLESCFALGLSLEDRIEIISELLIEKFNLEVYISYENEIEGIDKLYK